MLDRIVNYLQGTQPSSDALWKLIKELWDKGENRSDLVKRAKRYWEGELDQSLPANIYFPQQSHTNCNVIKPIVETKLKNVLDAQFTLAVLPDINSFYDYTAIKESEAVADIFNDEIRNIFKRNNLDAIQEKVARLGLLCGYGATKTSWSDKIREDGDILIEWVKSEHMRWSKGAETINEATYIAYIIEKSPTEIKNMFAKNPDGTFNDELCKQIDEISDVEIGDLSRKQSSSVINYTNSQNSTAGRAFAEGTTQGIQGGKVCRLICMYLLDDAVYAPEEKDDNEQEGVKLEGIKAFPNGRFIVFSLDEKKKIILQDEPAPEDFKNIGNIDIFRAAQYGGLGGHSEVSDLMPLQDRINGLFTKYREKIAWDFDTMLVDEDFGMEDNAIVRSGITRVRDFKKNLKSPDVVSNGGIEKAGLLLDTIDKLKQNAYEIARVNETMLYGARQAGTTSGEQVEMLQESPMADIRAIQRNFKDWLTSVGEKCLTYIAKNYTDQRLIKLSTGMDEASMARIATNMTDQPQQMGNQVINPNERYIELLDEAMQAIKVIKYNPEWKFKVDVVSGTEIPRSRREQAALTDKLLSAGLLGDINDIDTKEAYLRANDVPDYRNIIARLRRKEEQESQKPMNFMEFVSNPELSKSVSELLKSLTGFTADRAAILQGIGLSGKPDNLIDAPVQETIKQVDTDKILPILPELVSEDPQQQQQGKAVTHIELLNNTAKSAANLMKEESNARGIPVRSEARSEGR